MPINLSFINRQEQFGFVLYDVIATGDYNGRFTKKFPKNLDTHNRRINSATETAEDLLREEIRAKKRAMVLSFINDTLSLAFSILIAKSLTQGQLNALITNLDNILPNLGLSDQAGIKPPAYNKIKDSLVAIQDYASEKATLNQLNSIETMATDLVTKLRAL